MDNFVDWMIKPFEWFGSKLREGELPRIMILVVVSLTVIGVLVGTGILPIPRTAGYEADTRSSTDTNPALALASAMIGVLVGGYLGAALGIFVAYLYHLFKYG